MPRILVEIPAVIAFATACVFASQRFVIPVLGHPIWVLLDALVFLCIACPLILWRIRAHSPGKPIQSFEPRATTNRTVWMAIAATLFAGLLGTGALVHLQYRQIMSEARARFDRLTERLVTEATRRVGLPVYGLRGLRASFAANPGMRREDFNAYVTHRNLPVEFPGVLGMGFIKRVPQSQLEAFIENERSDSATTFHIKAGHWNTSTPQHATQSPAAESFYIITYLHPLEQNEAAWGLDVGGDTERRISIERAITTGTPTVTGKITLVQDQQNRTGFLYLVPVYHRGAPTTTPEERISSLWGVAFAPVILDVALTEISDVVDAQLDFEIFDGTDPSKTTELFDLDGHLGTSSGNIGPSAFAGRLFNSATSVQIADRQWTFTTSSTPAFESTIDRTPLTIEFVGGIVLTALLASVSWSLGTRHSRSLALAQQMTAELAAAKANAERLAEIARRTSNAVIITDPLGQVEWVNEGFTRISGYTLDEVRGKKPGHILQGRQSDPEQSKRMSDAVRNGTATNAEIVNYGKRGNEYRLAIEIIPLHNDNGVLNGFMAIESDITEQHAAREAAESANRAKSAFLANMSHEIRTPLTAILGFADLLKEDSPLETTPEQRHATIDTIRHAGAHLLTVINDILDISKIEAGKMTVEKIETSLVKIVRDAESMMRPRAQSKGILVTTSLTTPIPDRILSDPTRLRQILMNLIGNAVKFTENGEVRVLVGADTSAQVKRLLIDIEDTGPGITPEQAARLFQVFGQADDTVTRRFGGTGLGLTICLRLSTLMGGEVTLLRTEVGKGSCFRLALPLDLAPGAITVTRMEAAEEPPSLEQHSINLCGRILLAEDGPDNQRLISFHLRKAGATVDIADNGRIALEMLNDADAKGAPYHLLLSDMQMPEMDGYTLARQIRQRGNTLPIIALTAHAMSEDRDRCMEAGCDDYATKPIDKLVLLSTCSVWLNKAQGLPTTNPLR